MNYEVLAPAPIAAASVRMKLFGAPQLIINGETVSLPRRQMRALLYRLAVSMQPVAREHLCFLLWPDTPEATARRYLTVLLNLLRQALPEPDMLLTQQDAISLDATIIEADTVALAEALRAVSSHGAVTQLHKAVALYDGPFLDGFTLPTSPEFEAWVEQERQHWERRYIDALAVLVDNYTAQGAYSPAIEAAQQALVVDELAEDVHRRLIELYAANGDRTAALRQFERCVVVLERDLGVSPLPETRAVYEAVREGRSTPQKRASRVAPSTTNMSETATPSTKQLLKLPAATTPLIGRTDERAQVGAMLAEPAVRLLTLCGPGGSGKTRLAQQIAWDAADTFRDGVVFVPLAALRDPAMVVGAIASMLGAEQHTLAALVELLCEKHMLLLLDNFEHLLEAGPDIAALLHAAPNLQVLATSRAALHLQGEHTVTIPPLPLPDLLNLPADEALAHIPSVALLLARTQALNPRFQLNAENAADLAAICVRLDGLPLAIELAAARMKLLSPRDLLRRLDRRLALLTTGARDLPDRQQTLHATIDWSHRLLERKQQIWFERCSIFVGGWTLAAAEGLHERLDWPGQDATMPLDLLAELVDKSLIHAFTTDNGETRFDMLETIREFAAERLRERGAFEAVTQAHAEHFMSFVRTLEQAGIVRSTPRWVFRMKTEYDNILAAMRWHADHGEAEQAQNIATSLENTRFWRTFEREGLQWAQEMLANGAGEHTPQHAKALYTAAAFCNNQGHQEQAIALYQKNASLCREHGMTDYLVASLCGLGITLGYQGHYAQAIATLEECVAIARTARGPDEVCIILGYLAGIIGDYAQDLDRSISVYTEALDMARDLQRPALAATHLAGMGIAFAVQGNHARAAEACSEAFQLQNGIKDMVFGVWTLQCYGLIAYLRADYNTAYQYFAQSIEIALAEQNPDGTVMALEGLAGVAVAWNQPTLAARLLGAAEALRNKRGIKLTPLEYVYYTPTRNKARADLAENVFHKAWAVGRDLSLEQIVTEVKTIAPRLELTEVMQSPTK